MSTFLEALEEMRNVKRSLLCVGLDPALAGQRGSRLIPKRYQDEDENTARLKFCLDMVRLTSEYCCAYKPNLQYVLGWTGEDHRMLTSAVREAGAVSILDCKLGDIGDSVDSALYHIRRWGYDAITYNPLLGNTREAAGKAHTGEQQLGLIVLTLTSNPEALKYQKRGTIEGAPLFSAIAEDVKESGADGCVVGVTSHITQKDIRNIRSIVGSNKVFLIPGIGTQGGDLGKLAAAGKNILVNASRDIIYSDDPGRRAEEYRQRIRGALLA